MSVWYCYRYTRSKSRHDLDHFALLGTVEAPHQPAAWKIAARRWPEEARAQWPEYQSGRIACRRIPIDSADMTKARR